MRHEKILAVVEIAITIVIMIGPLAGNIWRLIIGNMKNYLV
jgi:hypothetical protein